MKTALCRLTLLSLSLLAACAAALAQERVPLEDARAPGSIKGRVIDEGGQPVPNIGVSAFGRRAGNRALAVSDEAGNFSLDNLEPGLYNFSFQLQGYVLARNPNPATGTFDGTSRRRVGDFVTVRLARGGVITGRVTDSDGEPVVAVTVRAFFVRRAEEPASRNTQSFTNAREFQTDDRGVYRIYGLQPGLYVVSAGGTSQFRAFSFNPYESDAPTYFPSATRDTAAEVALGEGQEMTAIDIRYRGERGHAVSGTVEGALGATPEQAGVNPLLVHAATGTLQGQAYVSGREGERGFMFEGVPDGEYELIARRYGPPGDAAAASAPLKVIVRGADVAGLKLTLAPLAAVAGTVALEPLPREVREASGCAVGRALLPEETSVLAWLDDRDAPKGQQRSRLSSHSLEAVAEPGGAFTLRGLDPGRYRLGARPAADDWYVRSISLSAPSAPKRPAPKTQSARTGEAEATAPDFLQLASGQRASGVRVLFAQGAASLRGNVAAAVEGDATPPPGLKVHLIPAERERAADPLWYYEGGTDAAGSFAFNNVAPGRYLLLARAEPAAAGLSRLPAAWDSSARSALRREAEAANATVELRPCQRVADLALRFPQAVTR